MKKKETLKPQSATKRRAKNQPLPNFLTGPEVQKVLGGISHVTLINLVKKGKLTRIGKAQVQGGGFLYDAAEVRAFAKTYKPQRNPASAKARKRGASKKRRPKTSARATTAHAAV